MKPLVQPSWGNLGQRRVPSASRRRNSPPAPRLPYSAFVAYASVPAAREALARVSALLCARGDQCRLQPMLWRSDQLDDPRWREMALRDAARADVLVLAFASTASLDVETEAWLAQLARRMRGTELTALAFTGEGESWTISLRAEIHRPAAIASPALTAVATTPRRARAETPNVETARAA